jgi:hypothetical protein
MKIDKGFAALVAENLAEKAKFENPHEIPHSMSQLELMMLQLVLRAAQGDSAALRWILKLLKENLPAPQRIQTHLYSLDKNGNVFDENEKKILGPLSDFPDLPYTSGPIDVPKEALFPKRKRNRKKA